MATGTTRSSPRRQAVRHARQTPSNSSLDPNKGIYLLVSALWEAYCEDLVWEACELLLASTEDPVLLPKGLPKGLRKAIAADVRDSKNELECWSLAGGGWKAVARLRLDRLKRETIFNSPKAYHVDRLFERALGLKEVSAHWVSSRAGGEPVRRALDDCISTRGAIAHGDLNGSVPKKELSRFYQLVSDLTECMDLTVDQHLAAVIGQSPWGLTLSPCPLRAELLSAQSGVVGTRREDTQRTQDEGDMTTEVDHQREACH